MSFPVPASIPLVRTATGSSAPTWGALERSVARRAWEGTTYTAASAPSRQRPRSVSATREAGRSHEGM